MSLIGKIADLEKKLDDISERVEQTPSPYEEIKNDINEIRAFVSNLRLNIIAIQEKVNYMDNALQKILKPD